MFQERTECKRCGRYAPSGRVTHVRGVALGPECLYKLRRREYIRANGPNSRMVKNEETGNFHTVSDHGEKCPEQTDYCLQCSFFPDRLCPAEIAFEHLHQSLDQVVKRK